MQRKLSLRIGHSAFLLTYLLGVACQPVIEIVCFSRLSQRNQVSKQGYFYRDFMRHKKTVVTKCATYLLEQYLKQQDHMV